MKYPNDKPVTRRRWRGRLPNKPLRNPLASVHIMCRANGLTYWRTLVGTWTLDRSERALYSRRDAEGALWQIIQGPDGAAPQIGEES